ncbi:hypothetical protein NPIL_611281 [Nephila pilipes]|uniref:Uncharacterized protein n=1 Tax=Nephila pilipes TaxID=299642 RepID=A0A8X6U095_NEPPI|nr:hypothetical protein NPIL_611281 [Nephila pilipes]
MSVPKCFLNGPKRPKSLGGKFEVVRKGMKREWVFYQKHCTNSPVIEAVGWRCFELLIREKGGGVPLTLMLASLQVSYNGATLCSSVKVWIWSRIPSV